MIRPALLILVPALAFPVMSYRTIAGGSTTNTALAAAEAVVPSVPAAPTFDMRDEKTYAVILERPIFSPSRRPVAAAAAQAGTESPSGLALLGVVAGAGRAVALIRTAEGTPATKAEAGQEVAGWQLTTVGPTEVTLERQGGRLQLKLPFKAAAPAPKSMPDALVEPASDAASQPADAGSQAPPEPDQGQVSG